MATYHPDTAPRPGDIWRTENGRERHVLLATPWSVTYVQVVNGRRNITRDCLSVVWHRWAAKTSAKCVQRV